MATHSRQGRTAARVVVAAAVLICAASLPLTFWVNVGDIGIFGERFTTIDERGETHHGALYRGYHELLLGWVGIVTIPPWSANLLFPVACYHLARGRYRAATIWGAVAAVLGLSF